MIAAVLAALFTAVQTAFAQAPGGVTGAAHWVKANQGVQATAGNQVEQWLDQSGSGNTTTELRAAHPAHVDGIAASNDILLVPGSINFNPAVDFSGAAGKSLKGNAASGWRSGGPISIFAVAIREGASGGSGSFGAIWTSHANWTSGATGTAAVGLYADNSSYRLDGNGCATAPTTSSMTIPRVIRGTYLADTNSLGGSTWIDGRQEGTGTNCGTIATTFFEIGGRTAGASTWDGRIFNGKIAEVVVYKSDLAATDDGRVESYLAIKYGITLNQTTPTNYVDSTGAVVWDATVNATHRNNIAGIGRDDTSALMQRQSQSVNTANSGNLVTMGLATIAGDNASNPNDLAADRTFLVWGDDGASEAFATAIATPTVGTGVRMTRTWRVQETGTVATAKVGVPATVAPGALLYLVVSSDAAFDNADQWLPMSPFTAGATSYRTADFDFTSGQYFTFAMAPLTDLALTKDDGRATYLPGKPISYTLVVTNAGPSPATGVSIADPVPATITGVTVGCTATGAASCGTNASSGNTVSFTGASVAAGSGHQLTITVSGTVDAGTTGNLTNTATVAAGAGESDPNTATNVATDIDLPARADVAIAKVGPATVTAGADVIYTITVTNNGPELATAVTVSDPTPTGLTFVSTTGACTTTFPCALGDLLPGATRTITATYRPPSNYTAPTPIVNTATVTTLTLDPESTNNTATVSTPLGPPQSDLQIVKNVSAAAVLPGQTFGYTLQVRNNGPSDAANVAVTDTLPAQTTFVSSVAGCTAAGALVTCPTIPTMTVGAVATFDLLVQLNAGYTGDGTDVLNSATVTSATPDPALPNNTNPAGAPPVGPAGADVTVVKTVSGEVVVPGQTFTYTLLVSNQGPSIATDVVVTDPLPAPIAFISSPQGCAAVGQDVTCPTLATLTPGSFATFTLVVQLDPSYAGDGSDLDNRATVQSPTPDPVPGNNTTPPVRPNLGASSADLSITKSVLGAAIAPGLTFTYRIRVTNAGPSVAQSVTTTDSLPGPIHFLSSQGCTAAGQVVTCTQALVAPGTTTTFDLLVQLDPAYAGDGSDLANVATTTSTTPDPNLSNNTTAPVLPPPIVPGSADVTVEKTGPTGAVPGGGEITYALVVTNQGPNAATNVEVQDPTPAGLTFLSTAGDCSTPFPCALGTIAPGLTKTITARYAVAAGVTSITNTATVSSSVPDPKSSNNSATAQTPTPAQTYYFSEGATGGFFDYDLSIANPSTVPAPVTLRFFRDDGMTVTETRTVAPQSRLTVPVEAIAGLAWTATSVQVVSDSGLPLAVERSMFWDGTAYAGHTGTAVTAPARKWYFAEGFQGYFDTFLLLENPGATPADATITFLREAETPFVKQVLVPPFTRVTLLAGSDSALFGRSFGIAVDSTQPIVAERSMYFGSTDTRLWNGGHSSAGVVEPTWRWFLPEGATGGFFDTWMLLSNPQSVEAHVTLDYQLPDGSVVSVPKVVPAQRRLTISVETEPDDRLRDTSVSTRVTSDVPIVAERSMYWGSKPEANPWSEGHNSFGVTESALRWGVAEGRVGGPRNWRTYLLLSNPQAVAANVTVTYLRENGAAPIVKSYTVPATTRFNIDVNATSPELQNESLGALIEVTNGVTIAVERSMYWDVDGVMWSGGTNAPGTKLP